MDDVSIFKSYLYKKKKTHVPFYHEEINFFSSSSRESMKHTQESLKSPVHPLSASSAMNLTKETMANSVVLISNQDISVNSTEPYCHSKLNSVLDLKDSTRKLLCLLEDIQKKTLTVKLCKDSAFKLKTEAEPEFSTEIMKSVTVPDGCVSALQRLEHQTEILQNIPTQNEEDDCSIFKRLTRKCNCLNQNEYNDFVINFNQKTKYFTNTTGEIFKNLRILKRFLYMGGGYCRHALMFLNEGLDYCSYSEKVEITQGCVHADMCNVFENSSLVTVCIAWPFKYDTYGDSATQESAAAFINKLAQFEEGRRYLLYTSKITRDIKKVLRKKSDSLSIQTLDLLEATLNALNPKTEKDITEHLNNDEGYGSKIINELKNYRNYMTSDEITTYLNLLFNYSCQKKGITELTKCMDRLVEIFQEILIGYDDSKMNIIITKVLNNLVNNTLQIQKENDRCPKILTIANVGTEAVEMKNKGQQSTFNYQVSFVNPVKSLLQDKRHKKKSNNKIKSIKEFASKIDRRRIDVIVVPKEEKQKR